MIVYRPIGRETKLGKRLTASAKDNNGSQDENGHCACANDRKCDVERVDREAQFSMVGLRR